MAFHPMRTFQKNRTFWMAAILLVCMVTFVLCTGMQGGDFAGWIMDRFRGSGAQATEIDGRTVSVQDLEELRRRRDTANDYMTRATQMVIQQLKTYIESLGKEPDDAKRKQLLFFYQNQQQQLVDRLSRPRYFRGGTKLDDLIDFLVWRKQADRLNIRLTDDAVKDMVAHEMLTLSPQSAQITGWGPGMAATIQRDMHKTYREVLEALTDEFRVRLAQMVLEDSAIRPLDPRRLPGAVKSGEDPLPTRNPTPPAELHDFYQKHLTPAEVAVLAIPIDDFLKGVPAPTEEQLKQFYNRYKDKKYDPNQPEPGFRSPERVAIQWVSVNPESPALTEPARALTRLLQRPAFLYDPMRPLTLSGLAYAAQQPAWDARLEQLYRRDLATNLNFRLAHHIPDWTTPSWGVQLYRTVRDLRDARLQREGKKELVALNQGTDAVSLLGGLVGDPQFGVLGVPRALLSYQVAVARPVANEVTPVLRAERKRRAPVGVTVVLSPTLSPLNTAALLAHNSRVIQFLPLVGPVKSAQQEKVEAQLARGWAQEIMKDVRAKLEAQAVAGHKRAFEAALNKLRDKYGALLEIEGTEEPRDEFDIADDPGLAPLRKSFEKTYHQINLKEGRAGTSLQLQAGDFHKLFFYLEKFGVGNSQEYQPRPWPPVLTTKPDRLQVLVQGEEATRPRPLDLFEIADRAFMFWKVGIGKGGEAQGLANKKIRESVERAWKIEKARDKIEPELRKRILTTLVPAARKSGAALRAEFYALAAAMGKDRAPTILTGVAPLTEKTLPRESLGQPITFYQPYEVPYGTFQYPRPDMTKDILALRDLANPLASGDDKINALNKDLFKETQKTGRVVQVLANNPKTTFYVVAMVAPPQPRDFRFFDAYKKAVGMQGLRAPEDLLIEQAYQDIARGYHNALRQQLQRLVRLGNVTQEAKKQFPDAK
jgi:hypothetical protein